MKLKYEFELMEMDEQTVALPIGEESEGAIHGIVKLNDSGAFIFKLLAEETTEDAIVAAMKKEYNASEEQIRAFVRGFVDSLAKQGLVDGVPAKGEKTADGEKAAEQG